MWVGGFCDLERKSFRLKANMTAESVPCYFELYRGIFLTIKKSRKNFAL
jgi:hypothetical protein